MRTQHLLKSRVIAQCTSGAQIIVPLMVMLLTYYQGRHALWKLAQNDHLFVVYAILLSCVAVGWRTWRDELPLSFIRLHRWVSVAIIAYLLLDPSDMTLVNVESTRTADQIRYGYWLAIVFASLSLIKPAALVFPSFYIFLLHAASVDITGFASHRLASVSLVESAQFLGISVVVLGGLWRINQTLDLRSRFQFQFRVKELAIGCMFIAISLHLSHYFWSGYEKLKIGEYAWSWIAGNQTHNLILSALYRGTLPTASSPAFTQWLFDTLSGNRLLLNTVSVVTQLIAIVAVLHVLTLRIMSLAYDALHVGIYLLTGLFLWPWIANNLAILYALKSVNKPDLTWSIRICCVVTIVLGGLPHFGNASRLAWWDARDITGSVVQAQDKRGSWHDIPLSYFNSHGQVVSMLMGLKQLPGHYSPTGWGGTREFDLARMSGSCRAPELDRLPESADAREERERRIARFLLAHHQKLLSRQQRFSSSHPYPALRYLSSATDFPTGIDDMDSIQAYRFVIQSVCLDLNSGMLLKTVVAEDELIVPVGLPESRGYLNRQ